MIELQEWWYFLNHNVPQRSSLQTLAGYNEMFDPIQGWSVSSPHTYDSVTLKAFNIKYHVGANDRLSSSSLANVKLSYSYWINIVELGPTTLT